VQSPGVVATQEPPLDIPLRVQSHTLEIPESIRGAYQKLRKLWITPDNWEIPDGIAMWRHARELSHGFYSVWDPRPPDPWAIAQAEWLREAREIIQTNRRGLDTELQVRLATESPLLDAWLAIKDTFTPNPVAVWISDHTVDWIADWAAANGPALLWTDRPALGRQLSRRHDIPYYGAGGVADSGSHIHDHDPSSGSACLSIGANKEGRNLQAQWYKNLVLDPPTCGKDWEQMLGRTHRDGQPRDTVEVSVLFGCIEDVQAFWRSVEDSSYAEEVTGQAQKLCHADLEQVIDVAKAKRLSGPQWRKK
jgi:hypothetical protein